MCGTHKCPRWYFLPFCSGIWIILQQINMSLTFAHSEINDRKQEKVLGSCPVSVFPDPQVPALLGIPPSLCAPLSPSPLHLFWTEGGEPHQASHARLCTLTDHGCLLPYVVDHWGTDFLFMWQAVASRRPWGVTSSWNTQWLIDAFPSTSQEHLIWLRHLQPQTAELPQ